MPQADAGRFRCAALTKRGRRCRNLVKAGQLLCRRHDPLLTASAAWRSIGAKVSVDPESFDSGARAG